MDFLKHLFHLLVTHNEAELGGLFRSIGPEAYVFFFVIVFCETGLVVTPFLPGDTLLLLAGTIAASGGIDPFLVGLVLLVAALAGDNLNYFLGWKFGIKLFHNEKSKIFNRRNLDKTHAFFEKYGGRTVLVARFLPIFRTFAPFVAGMGQMPYRRFMLYSLVAALLWVSLFVSIGFFAAKWAQSHMFLILGAILLVSAVPAVVEFARHYRENKREKAERAAKDDIKPSLSPEI